MTPEAARAVVWLVILLAIVGALWYAGRAGGGRSRSRVGPGTSGTIYDFLNEDKRKAIEIIVEERAEARDPEHADDGPVTGLKPKAESRKPKA